MTTLNISDADFRKSLAYRLFGSKEEFYDKIKDEYLRTKMVQVEKQTITPSQLTDSFIERTITEPSFKNTQAYQLFQTKQNFCAQVTDKRTRYKMLADFIH